MLSIASRLRTLALQLEDKVISTKELRNLFVTQGLRSLIHEAPTELQTAVQKITGMAVIERKKLENFHDTVKTEIKQIPSADPLRNLYQVLILQPIQYALGKIQFFNYKTWKEYRDALEQFARDKNKGIKERKNLLLETLPTGTPKSQIGEPEGQKVLRTTSESEASTVQIS